MVEEREVDLMDKEAIDTYNRLPYDEKYMFMFANEPFVLSHIYDDTSMLITRIELNDDVLLDRVVELPIKSFSDRATAVLKEIAVTVCTLVIGYLVGKGVFL